jgi:anti-sigma factor RsiW
MVNGSPQEKVTMVGFQRMRITDDEVNAYVDGALDPVDAAAIALTLRRNPDQAETVACYRAQKDALQALFGDIAREPVPAAMHEMVEAARQRMALTRLRNERSMMVEA